MTIIDRETMNTGIQLHRVISCDNQKNKEWVEAMLRFYNARIVEKHHKNYFGNDAGYSDYWVSCYCDTETWKTIIGKLRHKVKHYSGYHVVFKGVW